MIKIITGFPRSKERGLIEARGATSRILTVFTFRVRKNAASLKLDALKLQLVTVRDFPRSKERGLIEAQQRQACMVDKSRACPCSIEHDLIDPSKN